MKKIHLRGRDILKFTQQLSNLVSSGIEIYDAILFIRKNTASKALRLLLENVSKLLLQGLPLSSCLAQYPQFFSNFYCEMVHLGENIANLGQVLRELSYYLASQERQKKKIQSAALYPKILLFATFFISLVICYYILPIFQKIFDQYAMELPLITRLIFSFSTFIRFNVELVLVILIGVIGLIWRISKMQFYRHWRDYCLLKLFITRPMTINRGILEFVTSYTLLCENGMRSYESVKLIARLLSNSIIGEQLKKVCTHLQKGYELSQALMKEKAFNAELIEILATGEKSGQLVGMMRSLSERYETVVNLSLDRTAKLIEPLMLLMVAGIVIVLMAAVFVPMLGIINNFRVQF